MTDSVAQAAAAVKSDVEAISAADAASGATAAAIVAAGDAAHIAGADVAEVAAPAATTLFEKIKAELGDDFMWFSHEWDALKAAIAKHL